jgi:hypothetical protein
MPCGGARTEINRPPKTAARSQFLNQGTGKRFADRGVLASGGEDSDMTAAKTTKKARKTTKTTGKVKPTPKATVPGGYQVTVQGRLNLTDFASRVGAKPGQRFRLVRPRGNTDTWHLVPVDD